MKEQNYKEIYNNSMYELYIRIDIKNNFLYIKKSVKRSRLTMTSINKASRLFNVPKQSIKERIKILK